jgi:hypothetical protein
MRERAVRFSHYLFTARFTVPVGVTGRFQFPN